MITRRRWSGSACRRSNKRRFDLPHYFPGRRRNNWFFPRRQGHCFFRRHRFVRANLCLLRRRKICVFIRTNKKGIDHISQRLLEILKKNVRKKRLTNSTSSHPHQQRSLMISSELELPKLQELSRQEEFHQHHRHHAH